MTDLLEFDIPDGLWMSANDRTHWAEKARRTRDVRRLARIKAGGHGPAPTPVLVTAVIGYPRAGTADPGNAAPTVKAILDGLTDAGVWPDDDSRHVIGPLYRRGPNTGVRGLHRVRLVLTAQEVAW